MKSFAPDNLRSGCGKAGFTLVELLVAIAIVIVPAALSFVLFRSARAGAHRATCVGIMRQYGLAMNGYLGDSHNMLPSIQVNLQKPFYRVESDEVLSSAATGSWSPSGR